jgi:O-antigen/teichoic acid export membrane protein
VNKLLEILFGGSERFRSNFIKIASASLAAQVLGLLSLPLLTRLFSAQDFGVLTSFTMAQGLCLALVTWRTDWLIPNSRHDGQARRLLFLGSLILGVMTTIFAICVFTFKIPLAKILKLPADSFIIELLPIGLLAGGAQFLLQSWYIYKGDLTAVGWSKLVQAATVFIISLAAGFLAFTANGLVVAYVLGLVFAASFLWIYKQRQGLKVQQTSQSMRQVFLRLKHYGGQLAASTGLSFANVCLLSSLTFLILVYYGNTVLGWYGLVFRLATAPIGLITTGLVQSFWADAATLAKSDPRALRKFYIRSTGRLAILATPMACVFLAGPIYIPIIFGADEWSGAGPILAAVTPYLVGMIVFSPTTHLIVYNKAHWQLICDLTTLVLSVTVFSLVASSGASATIAILSSSLCMLFGYFLRFSAHLIANTKQVAVFEAAR